MRRPLLSAIAALCFLSVSGAVSAGSIVAIVEEVEAENAGVAAMDYVTSGRTISLGSSGRVILGYLGSCLQEVVVGGTVVVGEERSVIAGGKVQRRRVECDGGKLLLTAEQAGKSGVLVFRRSKRSEALGATQPSLRIFSLEPVIRIANRPDTATIERLDHSEDRLTVPLKNGVVDFAARKTSLSRGGIYRVSGGGKARVFRVDPYAVRGGPLIGRFVAF